MSFSENLQNLRKAHNISQEQLAEKLDVTRQTVSKWETGGYPEMDKIIALCQMFNVTMDELITGTVTVDDNDDVNVQEEPAQAPVSEPEPESEPLTYVYTNPEKASDPAPVGGPTGAPPQKAKSEKTAVVVAVSIVVVIAMLLISGVLVVWIAVNGLFGNLFGGFSIDLSGRDISLFGWGGTKYSYANASSYTAASEFTVADSITSIDADWIKGEVMIMTAPCDEIYVYESAENTGNSGRMRYKVSNGKLIIKFCEPGRFTNLKEKSLIITVPEELSDLISLDVSTVSADVTIESMSFSDTDIETVSGFVSLPDFNTPSLDVETVSGWITAYGSIGRADIDTVSGDVYIGAETACSNISITTVSGKIGLDAKSNFSDIDIDTVSGKVELNCFAPREIDIDTVSGEINVDGTRTKRSYSDSDPSGIGEIDIETTSGDITVKTK